MSNLRSALKGYDKLKSSGDLGKINKIKLDLSNTPISSVNGRASRIIFGKGQNNAELITRQYLLMRFADLDLNKQLLSSFASPDTRIVLLLPGPWRKIVSSHGIKISWVKSSIKWKVFLFKFLLTKILLLCRVIFDSFLQIIGARKTAPYNVDGKYAYFFSLPKNALPQPDKSGRSHDFISWYIGWKGRNSDVANIYHNVKESSKLEWKGIQIKFLESPFLPFHTKKGLLKYGLWCFRAIAVAILNLIKGRWWNILILEEAIQAAAIRYQNVELLAKEYYFNNSGWIYRPLWTYEAEHKGAEIHFYFYSTNCETFASKGRNTDFYYGYQSMNWSHYLVWDQYQATFVRNAVGKEAKISVVGPIWFSTSPVELPTLPNKTIAVFDVQPVRDAFYKTLGISFDYYVPKVCNQFLADIVDVTQSLNITMALKRKRDIGKKVHPAYRNYLEKIEHSANFIAVDANISAIKLIEKSSLVISMPFTSTAILGRELNKPSIFYDPLDMLLKDDPAAHGIPVISDIQQLRKWVSSHLVHQTSNLDS